MIWFVDESMGHSWNWISTSWLRLGFSRNKAKGLMRIKLTALRVSALQLILLLQDAVRTAYQNGLMCCWVQLTISKWVQWWWKTYNVTRLLPFVEKLNLIEHPEVQKIIFVWSSQRFGWLSSGGLWVVQSVLWPKWRKKVSFWIWFVVRWYNHHYSRWNERLLRVTLNRGFTVGNTGTLTRA